MNFRRHPARDTQDTLVVANQEAVRSATGCSCHHTRRADATMGRSRPCAL